MEFDGRSQRRMLRRAFAASVAFCLGVALVSCTAPAPKPSPTPTAIFASEEEALAAAEETYAGYLAVSDAVSADGGASPERIQPYVTDEFWDSEAEAIRPLVEAGYRTSGVSSFDRAELLGAIDSPTLSVRLCLDVSKVRVWDSAGVDVTPVDRLNRTPLNVELAVSGADDPLLIAKSDVWSSENFC